jgi:hypothetical protein
LGARNYSVGAYDHGASSTLLHRLHRYTEDGDSKPRRVAGFVSPNITGSSGEDRRTLGACGCDKAQDDFSNKTYQINALCPLNAVGSGPIRMVQNASPESPHLFL